MFIQIKHFPLHQPIQESMKHVTKLLFLLLTSVTVNAQHKTVLPVNDFEKAVQTKPVQLVDVRTAQEFSEGFIKNAVNFDWNNQAQFVAQAKKLDKTKPVYVYCLAGVRSDKAADWLITNGFSTVINLDGGIKAWKAANKKLETP